MKKLLHERLREWADSTEGDKYPSTKMLYATIESDHAPLGADDERKAFHLLADEIEKYYIPRPRFEDGEPVQFGDSFIQKCVNEEVELDKIGISLFTKDGLNMVWFPDEVVPRPEPKVLDADGVEIKVGDTVWLTTSGKKLRVDGFTPWKYVRCSNPEIDGDHEAGLNFAPESLTHREPDSLEKLRDDIQSHVTSGWHISTSQAAIYANRLTAIMERDA